MPMGRGFCGGDSAIQGPISGLIRSLPRLGNGEGIPVKGFSPVFLGAVLATIQLCVKDLSKEFARRRQIHDCMTVVGADAVGFP